MTRFEELLQRVSLLNSQLDSIRDLIGSEVRMILYVKLWGIVGELNESLDLGLDNTALDLTVDGEKLKIHYWSGARGSCETEVTVFIGPSFVVQRQMKNLEDGTLTIT